MGVWMGENCGWFDSRDQVTDLCHSHVESPSHRELRFEGSFANLCMRWNNEECMQCPLKLCQSGLDDAERDRAATVDVAVEGTQASHASILPTSVWESEEDDRKVAGACSEALRRLKTTSTAGEGGPVSQRPPQDGLQSLSDGTVNIRTGLADVGGRTGENDIGKLGEGGQVRMT